MQVLIPGLIIAGVLMLVLHVLILRWIFRVNKILHVLESIDRSLQYLPAVRDARARIVQRKAA